MSPDRISSILTQTTAALLITEEQIGSPGPSPCTCSNSLRTRSIFNTCITIPAFKENVGGCGQPWRLAIITSNIMAYFSTGGSMIPSPTSASALENPCMEILGVLSSSMYSPCSSGEYISPRVLAPLRVHHRCTTAINSNL